MKIRALGALAALTGAMFAANAAGAATYDAVSDFSIANNPNGPWSYEYTGGQLSDHFTLGADTQFWWDGQQIPNAVSVGKNLSGMDDSYETIVLPANTLALDPESQSVWVAFTAPTSGTYVITGAFYGIDSGENAHPVSILDGANTIYSSSVSSFGQSEAFGLSEFLSAGDVIAFQVGTGSTGCSYCNLSTGLTATITTAVPEASTWVMMAAGFAALGFMGYRGARKTVRA